MERALNGAGSGARAERCESDTAVLWFSFGDEGAHTLAKILGCSAARETFGFGFQLLGQRRIPGGVHQVLDAPVGIAGAALQAVGQFQRGGIEFGLRDAAVDQAESEDVDEVGRRTVLDQGDADDTVAIDFSPGSDTEGSRDPTRRRLLEFARRAEAVEPADDLKLQGAAREIKALLNDGFHPVVFCRFVDTADYVAKQLRAILPAKVRIESVTGLLPPAEREGRIAELVGEPGQFVLGVQAGEAAPAPVPLVLGETIESQATSDGPQARYAFAGAEISDLLVYVESKDSTRAPVVILKDADTRETLAISGAVLGIITTLSLILVVGGYWMVTR